MYPDKIDNLEVVKTAEISFKMIYGFTEQQQYSSDLEYRTVLRMMGGLFRCISVVNTTFIQSDLNKKLSNGTMSLENQ